MPAAEVIAAVVTFSLVANVVLVFVVIYLITKSRNACKAEDLSDEQKDLVELAREYVLTHRTLKRMERQAYDDMPLEACLSKPVLRENLIRTWEEFQCKALDMQLDPAEEFNRFVKPWRAIQAPDATVCVLDEDDDE